MYLTGELWLFSLFPDLVTFRVMDHFQISPTFVCGAALAYMHHLCGGNVVSNQNFCVSIVEVPVVCSFEVLGRIWTLNCSSDVALNSTDLEHQHESVSPHSPVGVVQVIVGSSDGLVFVGSDSLDGRGCRHGLLMFDGIRGDSRRWRRLRQWW